MLNSIKQNLIKFKLGRAVLGKMLTFRARRRLQQAVTIYYDKLWIHVNSGTYIAQWMPNTKLNPSSGQTMLLSRWERLYLPNKGDTVLYLGAGVGGETLMFSKLVGDEGQVISLEAHPKTLSCLKKTVELNNLSNVKCLGYAVAEASKTVEIENSDQHIGNSIDRTEGVNTIQVQAKSIDQICSENSINKLSLLAMNIEGAEKFAIMGMAETVCKIERLAISCHDFKADRLNEDFFRTKKEILQFVKDIGFILFEVEFKTLWERDWVYAYNPNLINRYY